MQYLLLMKQEFQNQAAHNIYMNSKITHTQSSLSNNKIDVFC